MKLLTLTTLIILTGVILLMAVGCERKVTGNIDFPDNSSVGCFTCHSDSDIKLTTARFQYDNSVHGYGANTDHNRLSSPGQQACERCHTHEGFIAYTTGVPAAGTDFTAINCFTCHAPHTNGNLTVRVNSPVTLENGFVFDRNKANTCATCHHSRRNVNTYVLAGVTLSGNWGPHHSNQSDMLSGENSYEFAAYTYTKSWHSTGVTQGCISCHMSNSMHESIGGHSWNMRNETEGYQNITGCNVVGCHDSAPLAALDRTAAADFDWDGTVEGTQSEIQGLEDSLHVLLETSGLINSSGVPISGRVVSTADSAGALYNFLFVEEDRSQGVHNTDYAVGLLQSSINFMVTGDPNGAPAGKFTLLNSH
jgi:hypothetical protein